MLCSKDSNEWWKKNEVHPGTGAGWQTRLFDPMLAEKATLICC